TSAYCFTITKSGAWFDTQQAWFSPCGTGTGAAADHACGTGGSTQFAAAANDGLKLTYCNAACWTAAGDALPANSGSTHYFGDHATSSTIPAGVYDFNAADAGLMAAVHYRWIGTTRTLAEAANHDWLSASASSGNPCAAAGNTFVGALSGYTLPTP